jgi:hypothetical protein
LRLHGFIGGVFVERAPAGPAEHVQVVQHDEASAALADAASRFSMYRGTSSAQTRVLYGGFMQW